MKKYRMINGVKIDKQLAAYLGGLRLRTTFIRKCLRNSQYYADPDEFFDRIIAWPSQGVDKLTEGELGYWTRLNVHYQAWLKHNQPPEIKNQMIL